jgi:mono/diheme cytochrome c family protein
MKRVLLALAGLVVLLALGAAAGLGWASHEAATRLQTPVASHTVDVPMPWPLSEAELEALRAERAPPAVEATALVNVGGAGGPVEAVDPLAGVDLDALALERSIARGQHLLASRYPCLFCHGSDGGGGIMVEDPALGSFLAPNLTLGQGGVTADYAMADWDRIVRHGIKKNGYPAVMPSVDFFSMSDQELSDLVAALRALPPVDKQMPAVSLGPIGKVLIATGKLPTSASRLPDHQAAHPALPPAVEDAVAFGGHVAQTCAGCHGLALTGGPIVGGAPDWPPAKNLTPAEDGLAGWTYEQFDALLTTGKRPDGTATRAPMAEVQGVATKMTADERRALWAYLQSLPPKPTGG